MLLRLQHAASWDESHKANRPWSRLGCWTGSGGDTFLNHVQSISFQKSLKTVEKPVTMKQLEKKYDDDQISDLLESGGITVVAHTKSSRVKMYIDHGLWRSRLK